MRRWILLAIAAAAATAVVAGSASATQLRVSPAERGFRLTWSDFRVTHTFNGTQYAVRCPVTFEGSFHNPIAKTAGGLIGLVTRASIAEAECTGIIGIDDDDIYPLNLRFLAETLPWHLQFSSFTGTLPAIGQLWVALAGVALETEGFVFELICLYQSTTREPSRFILERESRGTWVNGRLDSSVAIPRTGAANLLCGRTATTTGSIGSITDQGGGSRLTLTLI